MFKKFLLWFKAIPTAIVYVLGIFYSIMIAPIIIYACKKNNPDDKNSLLIMRMWIFGLYYISHIFRRVSYEIRGEQYIPKQSQSALLISKHQSVFDIFLLASVIRDINFVAKKELLGVPLLSHCLKYRRSILIDRKASVSSTKELVRELPKRLKNNARFTIFPEGHRYPPFTDNTIHNSIYMIYKSVENIPDIKIIPVALNTGMCWPKNFLDIRGGHMIIEFLPPIEKNLSKEDFLKAIEIINIRSRELCLEFEDKNKPS